MSLKCPSTEELATISMIPIDGRMTRRRSSMLLNYVPLQLSPFDNLPNEVIINIMCFLDPNSVKNALLVDKRFNKLCVNSLKVMNRLPLTVGNFKGAQNRDITEFNRRYRSINFKGIPANKWFKYMKQSLNRIGKDVSKVNFQDCQFTDFFDIVSCFPNAEKISLVSIRKFIDINCEQTLEPAMFPKLKQLKIEFITSILKSFVNLQLQFLQILQLEGQDWEHLSRFLKNQTNLRDLTLIDVHNIPNELEFEPLKGELKLNSLGFLFLKNINVAKFIEFLMLFVAKLKCLTIVKIEKTPGSQLIFETVLKKFRGLTGLAVAFDHFPKEEEFYRKLEPNHTLKSLAINCSPLNNPVGFRGVISAYPSLQALSISITSIGPNMTVEDFTLMYETLKKLQKFFLVVSNSRDLNGGFFKKITSLNVSIYSDKIDWAEFSRKNPNLNSLIISKISNPKLFNFESAITNLKNLSSLELGEGFTFKAAELKIITEKGKKLKDFKMLQSSWKVDKTTKEVMETIDGLHIKLQASAMESVSFYGNTFFFKSS